LFDKCLYQLTTHVISSSVIRIMDTAPVHKVIRPGETEMCGKVSVQLFINDLNPYIHT